MTTRVRAHFDGKHIVPDEPVDLPVHQPLSVHIEPADVPPIAPDRQWIEALNRLVEQGVEGANIPAEALRRENLYDDGDR